MIRAHGHIDAKSEKCVALDMQGLGSEKQSLLI